MDGAIDVTLPRAKSAIFLGSKSFGLAILKALITAEPSIKWTIIHPDDRSDPRSKYSVYESFAQQSEIELKLVKDRGEADAALFQISYDIAFVCGWYWLLGDHIVGGDAPPAYGIHNSLLPRYRGGAPLVWSILNGEREVGGSLFRLSKGIDDGDIALQVKVVVNQCETVGELLGQIEARFTQAIPKVWKSIISGQVNLVRQESSLATYCAQRRPEDGLVDWSDSAQNIHNFIRAQSKPYPCAFTFCAQTKIYVDRAEVFPAPYLGRPGQIVERSPSYITVTTGAGGALRITEAHDEHGTSDLRVIFRPGVRLLGYQQEACHS